MVNDDKVVRKDDWRKLQAMLWPMFRREKMTVRSGVLVFSVIRNKNTKTFDVIVANPIKLMASLYNYIVSVATLGNNENVNILMCQQPIDFELLRPRYVVR